MKTDDHIKHFMRQMLKALKYMHASSVIHRDIKPGNILLTEDCQLRIWYELVVVVVVFLENSLFF